MFGGNLFNKVYDIIEDWEPEKDYPNENGFRDDLLSFLREELNKSKDDLFGGGKRVSVKKEDGRGLCDIAVNGRVGIELKKDLRKKAQIDRLGGQIIRYKKAYDNIIVVLVGDGYPDAEEDLKDMTAELSDDNIGLTKIVKVKVIDKTWEDEEEEDEDTYKPSTLF
jgi:hypothetical protein